MTDMQAWLDQGKTLADRATEGPWEADGREIIQHWQCEEPWLTIVGTQVGCIPYCYGGSAEGVERDEDAAFIADARTRLPQALNALQAILDLHKPIEFVGHSATWLHCTQGCATYPCPTVRAITDAIGGGDE